MAGGVTNPIMPGGYALAGKWARAPLGGLDLEGPASGSAGHRVVTEPSDEPPPFPEPHDSLQRLSWP